MCGFFFSAVLVTRGYGDIAVPPVSSARFDSLSAHRSKKGGQKMTARQVVNGIADKLMREQGVKESYAREAALIEYLNSQGWVESDRSQQVNGSSVMPA